MGILAGKFKKIITLTDKRALKYKEGRPEIRAYDSCYYEINSVPGSESIIPDEEKKSLKLVLRVTNKRNMNVYVYQGKNRENATIPINGNKQVETDIFYTVPYKEGMLLIAFPNKDVET